VQLTRNANADVKQQLFMRAMASGLLAERDRLLTYTMGEFYQEMSLFITECEEKNRELEKLKNKR
jgi:hypothetical protein